MTPSDRVSMAKKIHPLRELVCATTLDRAKGRAYLRSLGFVLPGDPAVDALECASIRGLLGSRSNLATPLLSQ
jgi:hypothetical protein